jgi:hypothetical protein
MTDTQSSKHDDKRCGGLIRPLAMAMLICAGIFLAASAVGGQESAPASGWEEAPLHKDAIIKMLSESAGDPRAGFRAQILVLADIHNTPVEVQFYEACLDEMAKGGKAEIPALEKLLNSYWYWSCDSAQMVRLVMVLRPRASKIWFDLVWADANDAVKRQTALYAFQPTPPVRPEHWECRERLMRFGKAIRPDLYKVLMNPSAKMDCGRWTLETVSFAVDLLVEDPNFAPSPMELQTLLAGTGTFGQTVGLGYSAKTSSAGFPAAFDSFVSKHLDDPQMLYDVGYYARFARKLSPDGHAQLTRTLVKMGLEAQKRISHPKGGLPYADWFGVLYTTNMVLRDVGPGPAGREYLKACQDFLRRLDTKPLQGSQNPRYWAEVAAFLEGAAKYAESALSKP